MAELLLELLSEEIPARMQARAVRDLGQGVGKALGEAELSCESIEGFATPRRLALVVRGLPPRQPDVEVERRGPRVGAPAKAVQGFLGSLGTGDYELSEEDDRKGRVLVARFTRKGRPTREVLGPLIEGVLARLPWPKSMRWGAHEIRWVRPLHGIVCVLDGEVVPLRFGPLEAGTTTRGHRFMAPEPFEVRDFRGYATALAEANVILESGDRRRRILDGARELAAREGLVLREDAGLLDELAGLVEWPVPLLGRIDESFMELPDEVLATSMRQHQKFLALEKDGRLAPFFVVVANLEADDGGTAIVAGNERVLRARLWDARFFWDQDRRHSLESRLPLLESMVFHARLGSLAEKTLRLQGLAGWLAGHVPGADREHAVRAAGLCKSDLVTGMVGEFPELQGIMGRYYALHDGDPAEVAEAIAEHYAPRGPNDSCPTAPVSVVAALADKLDTLSGLFAIGERPTGSGDPFALRRAALGIIRLVLERRLRLPLREAFLEALRGYGHWLEGVDHEAVASELLAFVTDRLEVHLREEGVRHDLVTAVFEAGGDDDLVRLLAKVAALARFLATDDGANLLTAHRRASNIVRIEERRDGASYRDPPSSDLLEGDEERALQERLDAVQPAIAAALGREDFEGAMAELARLRRPVDDFFDHVLVNTDDAALRANRLRLLSRIGGALDAIAAFERIEEVGERSAT
jgi:glycyl-tRNA synthetase beta chain